MGENGDYQSGASFGPGGIVVDQTVANGLVALGHTPSSSGASRIRFGSSTPAEGEGRKDGREIPRGSGPLTVIALSC